MRGPDSVPTHFRVIKLRDRPRHPTQIEAHAVLYRGHIQVFRHCVYMHYWSNVVNCDFGAVSCRGSVSRLSAGFVTHLVFRYSSIRRSFVDGWNVTPSIRCSGNCTG